MFRSLRKGCMQCGGPLSSTKEKMTRTCSYCANKALQGFQTMSEGNFKEGFKEVLSTNKSVDGFRESIVRDRMDRALNKRRSSLEKKLRKKGLSEDEISKGLGAFQSVEQE